MRTAAGSHVSTSMLDETAIAGAEDGWFVRAEIGSTPDAV
jgi:hypothetical protein